MTSALKGVRDRQGSGVWWNGVRPGHLPLAAELCPARCVLHNSCRSGFPEETELVGCVYTGICSKEWLIAWQVPRPAGLVARFKAPRVDVSESKAGHFHLTRVGSARLFYLGLQLTG